MASSEDLLAQRNKLQHQILALEQTLGNDQNIVDLLSSDNDSAEESDDSGHAQDNVAHEDLEAERQQIQKEIEELERTLGADAALVDALTDSEHGSLIDSGGEESDDDLDLPQDLETCLQMNLVYQEVLKEKLADLEKLLKENREQQKDLEEQLSGPSYVNPGLPHLKLFLGSFMKPYFKDKLTGLGPPANEETKERLTNGTKPCDEKTIRRWEPWQKILLINSVVTDTMKRMLQPKLSKMEYLTAKMAKAKEPEKEELQNQLTLLEKDIEQIRSLKEDQLYGDRHGDHDWDKIANIDFEGFRQPDDLMSFWQNYLHPSINKSTWNQEEIAKLADVAEKHNYCHWDQIAESLGTNRTAFMCFQTYQRYISKCFRKREWTKEEDQVFRDLVDKMRIGSFIPYTQISYFMEGRDSSQLIYRWTCVLDPSIKKGPWTKEEDQLLLKAVKKYGCKEWWKIRLEVPGRTDNACRDRYLDCLRDDIKRGAWDDEEVELLKQLVEKHGVGKWAKIASEIPNRVDSQCLNKWKWMMQLANRKGGRKRRRRKKTSRSGEPQLKRRRVRRKKVSKEDFGTESDTSEDEKEQVLYMDNVVEEVAVVEENIPLDEDCRLEYVQPDMKEWIPARRNNLAHSLGNLKTTWVRLPTEAEGCDSGSVHITVLDKLGNAVKTYVGMEPPALQKWNSSNEHAMIMVSECDIKRLLISMKASVIKARTPKTKTSSSSCTNQKNAEPDEEVDKSEMESGQRKRRKPIPKAVATKQLNYDLMLAITPWVGNVIMPLSFRERQVCEADVVRNRAADVPLLISPVFLFFLQALKVDVDGCKKVIEARKNKVYMTPGPESRPDSAKKPTPGSRRRGNTVADLLAKRTEQRKRYRSLKSPVFVDSLLFPQPAKIAIPRRPQPQKKTKQVMQPGIQKKNAAVIPHTFATSHNVTQGILPFLQLSAIDASKNYPPVVLLAMPVNSGCATESASCPTPSVSTTKPPTDTVENVSTPKRKHKPTIKAQALMENKRDLLPKKKQLQKNKSRAAAKQQKGSVPQTVTVLPQTTAWIVTPAGLMPVAGIQVQAPGISRPQNNLQMVFQPPVIVNQSTCVTLDGLKLSNPAPDLPGNNIISQTSGPNCGENTRPSSVSDNTNVSSFPSSSNFPSVGSSAVTNKPGVLQALPGTNMPTSITGSVAQVTPFKTACHENKPVTSTNPMSSLVRDSSSDVCATQNLTESCISDITDSIPKVSAVTSTCVPSLNISVSGTVSGPQSQQTKHHVSEVQPIIVNHNGSLAPINPAVACLISNAPLTPTTNVTRVSTNSTSPNISVAEPCLIKNAPPTSTANVPPNSTTTKINMSVPPSSTNSPATSSSYLIIPTPASSSLLNAIPPSSIVNSSVPISVGGYPTDQLCVNPATTPMNTNCQFPPQTMVQQMASQAKKQPIQGEVTTPNPTPKPITFDPSLMFFEPPSQVNNWRRGMGGIILPDLKDKIPYLPPFVSSINTLTTLLKGRDSLLMSAVQLLPEEHRDSTDDDAKIAALRKMVSERFKTNQAYLLMKARFLSCFTLPALLATIDPNKESTDDLDQENDVDNVEPKLCGDEDQPLGSLLNVEGGHLTATQFPGVEARNDNHISATI